MKLTYCSFADDAFLGVVILEGHLNPIEAAVAARSLGLNPGGQLLAVPVPEDLLDLSAYVENRNRLITDKRELAWLFGGKSLGEWRDDDAAGALVGN